MQRVFAVVMCVLVLCGCADTRAQHIHTVVDSDTISTTARPSAPVNPWGAQAGLTWILAGVPAWTAPPAPVVQTTATGRPRTANWETAPPVAAEPSSGRCGGDLPSCSIMMCESGGNLRAQNPHSTASGKWQILDSTWGGYGGFKHARDAPESLQDDRARALWAGGRGRGQWSC